MLEEGKLEKVVKVYFSLIVEDTFELKHRKHKNGFSFNMKN